MKKLFTGLSIYDFLDQFGDDKSCIDTLILLKWPKGFKCRECGYDKYCSTKRYGERRCNRCGKPESATAHTLFHKLKFPIHKAFFMLYHITTMKKGISAQELHRKVGVNKKTALLFKRKAMEAMASLQTYKMTGEVEVDESYIGKKEVDKPGRSKGAKKLIAVGIERNGPKGISRAYVRVIKGAGVKQLKPFFEDFISKQAQIRTDGWRSYTSLKKKNWKVTQEKSSGGKNFDSMHRFIMGLKSYIRGVYGSVRDLQSYINEYVFKFNRHLMKGHIFNVLLKRMANFPPRTYKEIFYVA